MNINMIDTAVPVTRFVGALAAKGIKYVSRYITRTSDQYKVIHRPEAEAITAVGMRIIANYEGAGATIGAFNFSMGLADARYARAYGFHELAMPDAAAIYFSSEAKFDPVHINQNIIPYFKGVKQAMSEPSNYPVYKIGAYSSGSVLVALIAAGLIDYNWLPNALGWEGSRAFLASGKWMLRQLPTVNNFVHGLNVDPGLINPTYTGPIGDFGMDGTPMQPLHNTSDHPTLELDDTGAAVVVLQNILGLEADGDFGPKTEAAVKAFQGAHGLAVDGVVGENTWSVLEAMQQIGTVNGP